MADILLNIIINTDFSKFAAHTIVFREKQLK